MFIFTKSFDVSRARLFLLAGYDVGSFFIAKYDSLKK